MAVATLLHLEDQCPLSFKRGRVMNVLIRDGITAPRIHVRTPRRVSRELCERAECYSDQRHGQNRDRSSLPTLFTFARKKRKKQQTNNDHDWSDQQRRCFERRRKQRQQSIEPQEEVIRLWDSLDDCRIGPSR